jgi:hypothetical protein
MKGIFDKLRKKIGKKSNNIFDQKDNENDMSSSK